MMEIGGKAFVIFSISERNRKLYGHGVLMSLKLGVIADPPFFSVQIKPTLSLAVSIRGIKETQVFLHLINSITW